jgi:hypothetical protein
MKIAGSFFAILLAVPFLIPDSEAAEMLTRHDLLITQACQMGRADAKAGKVMDSMGISLNNAGSEHIKLVEIIMKEYKKCYTENKITRSHPSVSSIDNKKNFRKVAAVSQQEMPRKKAKKDNYSSDSYGETEFKLPPNTSEKPFAWFHDWISVVEEAPDVYAKEKKRAEDLRQEFNKRCQQAYLVRETDQSLIKRWCKISGWRDFKVDSNALHDDLFNSQLEQMKQQVGYSELAYRKHGERDVKNAFDRSKGASLDYKMSNIEQRKVLPYLSGASIALANIKTINSAMSELDQNIVAERKRQYVAELVKQEEKRIKEENKRIQKENHKRYLKQKTQADKLIESACSKGREDALNQKKLQPNQYQSQAQKLYLIDGLEGYITSRYTECYDTELISLTCKKAAEDYMSCRIEEIPSTYVSLASNKMIANDLQQQYKNCYEERKELYTNKKIKVEKRSKNILKYSEIYWDRGDYFINDYNKCVASITTSKNPHRMEYTGLADIDIRSCEDKSRLLEKYASQNCSCSYGVVIDALDEIEYSEFSEDILALIKFSHSNTGSKQLAESVGKELKKSLRRPLESIDLFKKIGDECTLR